MSAPKKILIVVQTEHGDYWRVEADMEGAGLGVISVSISDALPQTTEIKCNVDDVDALADALRHTATSIAWIQEHGLEPTCQGDAEPQPWEPQP